MVLYLLFIISTINLLYSVNNNSIVKISLTFKSKGLYYKGVGGMSNIILGYYSSVYLSVLMKRFFKTNYIHLLYQYYKIPKIFITNNIFNNTLYINELTFKKYNSLKGNDNIYMSTCHDLLESIIELCKTKILKCLFINIHSHNIIHQIYKLRNKLINELLIPSKKLINSFNNFKRYNIGFIIGVHIRTSIYSDFKENCSMFYNNQSEKKYYQAIDFSLKKYHTKNKYLYIISDSSKIKSNFIKKYKKYICKNYVKNERDILHRINERAIKEQYILSKCDVIIGSCASTYTLLSVFKSLKEYYAIEGVKYSSRGKIEGKCGYKLDYNHLLF